MLVFQLLPATLLAAATLLPSFSVASSANAGPLTPSSSLLDPSLVKHKPHQKRLLCQLTGLFCNFNTDENNCGSYGYKCQTTWANGAGALCLNGICGAATCATGYAFNWSSRQCVNINNDVNNCGAVGRICNNLFALSHSCSSGGCLSTSCMSGYTPVGGVCTKVIDTLTDMSNCGALKNVCPTKYDNGVGSVCLAGQCQPLACGLGFGFSFSDKKCINVYSDLANCGSVGTVCNFAHGSGSCVLGGCVLTGCNPGYFNILGSCLGYDLQNDVLNCGAVGAKCPFSNGVGICSAGKCITQTCTTPGYALVNGACVLVDTRSDALNCGFVGNKCQGTYLNGGVGTCVNGACYSTCGQGFTWNPTSLYCQATSNDVNNCGGVGVSCASKLPGSLSTICAGSACFASTCLNGYNLISGACSKIDTTSDVNNCGFLGRPCTFLPTGATGACVNSVCKITACPTRGYVLSNGVCIAAAVSQRARVKKSKVVVPTLCPAGEQACPILNSASFEMAVSHHFTAPFNEVSGVMGGAGGYECLDTTQALESCGGCASTGEGQDCTQIKGARGVGCDQGVCRVFSCVAGSRPNLAGTKCVAARGDRDSGRNNSRRAARRRHVAAAHGHGSVH